MKSLQNINSEYAVLSNACRNADSLFLLLEYNDDIFSDVKNVQVIEIIRSLVNSSGVVSILTIQAASKISNDYFINLATFNSHGFEQKTLLIELEKMSRERFIYKQALDLFQNVRNGKADFDTFIDEVSSLPEQQETVLTHNIADCNDISLEEHCNQDNFQATGISGLDDAIIGIYKTHLIVIAGSPASGKSTLLLNIISNIKDSLIVSKEMDKVELYIKLLSRYSGIDSMKIEKLDLTLDNKKKIDKAKLIIKDLGLMVIDEPLSFSKMMVRLEREVKIKKIKSISIDYLQLLYISGRMNREEQLSFITSTLKQFAMKNKVPVILLSQLTKDAYKDDKEPTLSDLRGSGSIGQDANTVLFTHKGIIVAKVRKGKVGRIDNIFFKKDTSEFIENYGNGKKFERYSDVSEYIHN